MEKVFDTLMEVNVNGHTERKKTGNVELTYLSWPFAWAEVKKRYPEASYEVVKFNGLPYVYDPQTGYMVYTRLTIEGVTHEMWLPVMDGANKAMKAEPYTYMVKNPNHKYAKQAADGRWVDRYGNEQPEFIVKTVEAANMFDINKTVMRCLVKNIAMFGLGLYIFAGEDLPITESAPQNGPQDAQNGAGQPKAAQAVKPTAKETKAQETAPAEDRAKAAYPSREEMLRRILAKVPQEHIEKWLTMWKVKKLSDVNDTMLMGMYGHYDNRGAFAGAENAEVHD